ncbi:DUF4403 family protein [Pricia sp. S334]|uniref:DUF4403 family protein n=1 Tax=Pricia mediterranea TaxID=3076079 RepID=A0ABU3L206_9FLAO|nr:DUF4403 family protein [Pricia sp. S334]MDT7827765.1 DUF4403 family protein [Pricia sp. S334]
MENVNQNLTLPIKIPYEILQQLTDKNLIGIEIGTDERKHGRILGTSLGASLLPDYDVVLGLKMQVLRKYLGTKEVAVFIQVALAYDADSGELSADTFKIASKSKSFLLDKTLQILANRIYYRKVLNRATYNLNELIDPHLHRLNKKLRAGIPVVQGIHLQGRMDKITIPQISVLTDHILVHVHFNGGIEVNVRRLPDADFKL